MMMMSFERVCLLVEKLIKPLQIPLNPTELFICHSFNKEERGPTRTRTTHNFFNWETDFSKQTFFFNWKSDFCSIENGAFLPLKTHYSSIQNRVFLLLRKVWSLDVWTHMDMMKSTADSVFSQVGAQRHSPLIRRILLTPLYTQTSTRELHNK